MGTDTSRNTGFSAQEREAMRTRARELAAEQRANRKKADGEKDALAAIAAMTGSDRTMARRIHELVTRTAPDLWPKTWYGMPAYAREGKVICFFKPAKRFAARYASFGFSDAANLDDGNMWPESFALRKLAAAEEKKVVELVRKAVS
jgi:uncharacterized protein YdhG (YjbR/CyaY superfamily)